jgi:hypothetical protein
MFRQSLKRFYPNLYGPLLHYSSKNQITALYARCTVSRVLAMVPERDDHWVELAANTVPWPVQYQQADRRCGCQ